MTGALVALVEQMTGRHLDDLEWRELLRVRDRIDAALNAAVNQRQAEEAR